MADGRGGPRNYTRWTRRDSGLLCADLLGMRHDVVVHHDERLVELAGTPYTPDEARLLGVRLIEAAALADGDRAVRTAPPTP